MVNTVDWVQQFYSLICNNLCTLHSEIIWPRLSKVVITHFYYCFGKVLFEWFLLEICIKLSTFLLQYILIEATIVLYEYNLVFVISSFLRPWKVLFDVVVHLWLNTFLFSVKFMLGDFKLWRLLLILLLATLKFSPNCMKLCSAFLIRFVPMAVFH